MSRASSTIEPGTAARALLAVLAVVAALAGCKGSDPQALEVVGLDRFGNQESLNANSLFNNAFGLPRPELKKNIYGASLGGPIVKNKMFFFGSWERYSRENTLVQNLAVPTAKMRAGDFTEVAAAYSRFQLYSPLSGAADGTGRSPFANYNIGVQGALVSTRSGRGKAWASSRTRVVELRLRKEE